MDNEIATLLKGLAEKVGSLAKEVAALREENAALSAEAVKSRTVLRSVGDALRCGNESNKPWDSLPKAKAAQVRAVVDYLSAHPKDTVNVAVERTFVPSPSGYTNAHSLKCWCYRRNVTFYS